RVGAFYYRHDRLKEAEVRFQKSIDLTPDNHNGYLILGGLYIAMGKYDEAEKLLKKSLSLKPTGPGYSNLGTLYFERRRYSEAVGMYEKAVELGAANATIVGDLADAYRLSPKLAGKAEATYNEAIRLAEQRLAVNPNDAPMLSSLAVYHMRVG